MADHNDFGKLAEDLAADFLVQKNYKILVRNYRFQKAEIDIIAEFDNQVIVVEVKARNTNHFIEPQEAVTKSKIKLIVKAADEFLRAGNISKEVRFDIVTVLPNEAGKLQINHIESAFEAFDAQ